MDASSLSNMATPPSAQNPTMTILEAFQAYPTTRTWGPFKLQDIINVSGVASHVPQNFPAKGICISVNGPPQCEELVQHNADREHLCNVAVHVCSSGPNQTDSKDSVVSTASSEDSDMDMDKDSDVDYDVDDGQEDASFDDFEHVPGMVTATDTPKGWTKMPTKAGMNLARIPGIDIPMFVQDALVNDKNAARSLAKEFSGNNSPDWYKQLPEEQRHLFMSERPPKVGLSPPEANPSPPKPTTLCDPPRHGNKAKQYRKQQRKIAHLRAKLAKKQSKLAQKISCSAMASSAKAEASRAATEWKLGHGDPGKLGAAPSTLAVTKASALYAISITIAAATLGIAMYL